MTKIYFQTKNLHLDNGEIVPGTVMCAPGEALEVYPKEGKTDAIVLHDNVHIALGRVDPHVHFRESYIPTRDEFEADPFDGKGNYDETVTAIRAANSAYDVFRGTLAALKGGVWCVAAMGNTPWSPKGYTRWLKTCELYWQKSSGMIEIHVIPRADPNVPPIVIPGIHRQEDKDFASTFGGKGLSNEERRRMYFMHRGQRMSYHNDQPRSDETLADFARRTNPKQHMIHHLYFDGETVLACQRETIALAREAGLESLLTRHIPSGAALRMVIDERKKGGLQLPAEIGLDYLYFNRDMLERRATSMINYRRPALPSEQDQEELMEVLKVLARRRDPLTFIASDHAPHTRKAKEFKNGLPGSPGTRILEHSNQIHMNLIHNHGFTHQDIDWLTSITPAHYVAQYRDFPFLIGTMQTGAMANLIIFDPDEPYRADEWMLRQQLADPDYHTAYRDEKLRGRVLFTVVDGIVYDVKDVPVSIN
jgi:dihydroorotase-like cyclic amidohydrolase